MILFGIIELSFGELGWSRASLGSFVPNFHSQVKQKVALLHSLFYLVY